MAEHLVKQQQVHQTMSFMARNQPPDLARSEHELFDLRELIKTAAAQVAEQKNASKSKILWTSTSNSTINVSKTPLKNLERIGTLQRLLMEQSAKGGYIILRTLEPAYTVTGINTCVEDVAGNGVAFALYNFTSDPNPDLDEILPAGTIFLLKEPYMKLSGSGQSVVRCDSPSDMIVLHKEHRLFKLVTRVIWRNFIDPKLPIDPVWRQPEPKTASEWRMRGNDFFDQGKCEFSARCYLMGLQQLEDMDDEGPLMQILQLNLSAAYIRLKLYEKSLEFAEKVLNVEPVARKALLRAGRSCYKLRKYQDAKIHFEKYHDLYPEDQDAKLEFQNAKDRCLEQDTGVYNMRKIFLAKSCYSRRKIDCADYVGPVKIIAMEGKGRGMVATEDLEPGTLLVVSKALAFAWEPEDRVHLDFNSDQTIDLGNRQDIIADLAQVIAKNPHTFGPVIYDLFDGKEHVNNVSSVLFCDPETKKEPIVDVQRLKDILNTNSFGENCNILKPKRSTGSKWYDGAGGSGLFPVPSYFNHSCLPNAVYDIYNDVMFVHAIAHIKAEEEVFLSYFDNALPFLERLSSCQTRGFKCFCILCTQDRNLPNSIHRRREDIYSNFNKIANKIDYDPDNVESLYAQCQLEKLTSDMDDTYCNCGPNPVKSGLFSMYLSLVTAYTFVADQRNSNLGRVIQLLHNSLTVFGLSPQILLSALEKGESLIPPNAFLSPNACTAISALVLIYHETREFDLKSKWLEILCALEKVCSGADIEAIKLKHDNIKDII